MSKVVLDAMSYVAANSTSNHLDFHWFHHLKNVAMAARMYGVFMGLEENVIVNFEAAAWFHDTDHLGELDTYVWAQRHYPVFDAIQPESNISNALNAFYLFSQSNSEAMKVLDAVLIPKLMKGTKFPYEVQNGLTNDEQEWVNGLRDADQLASRLFYTPQEVARMLSAERELEYDSFIRTQPDYVRNLRPKTKWWQMIYEQHAPRVLEILAPYDSNVV